jgi:hypothetical protein
MHDTGDTGRTHADVPPNPSRRAMLAATTAALIAGARAATAAAYPEASVPDLSDVRMPS